MNQSVGNSMTNRQRDIIIRSERISLSLVHQEGSLLDVKIDETVLVVNCLTSKVLAEEDVPVRIEFIIHIFLQMFCNLFFNVNATSTLHSFNDKGGVVNSYLLPSILLLRFRISAMRSASP